MIFKLLKDPNTEEILTNQVFMIDDNGVRSLVPNNQENRHWQMYQEWLLAGNTPEVAE